MAHSGGLVGPDALNDSCLPLMPEPIADAAQFNGSLIFRHGNSFSAIADVHGPRLPY
jgi:hypothetical protein